MDQGQDNQYIDEYPNYLYNILNNIYDALCVIECDIINKFTDIDVVNNGIKKAISLIRESKYEMPTCILIKLMQISQLLLQYNDPILDDGIKKFQQLAKKYEKVDEYLFMIKNTENYEISKAFIYDYRDICFVSLSHNEKYLLVGTLTQVYLYDILTKLNKKIHKGRHIHDGVFSQNSKQIVLNTQERLIIIDLKTNKKQYFKKQNFKKQPIMNISCYRNKNYLHLNCNREIIIKIDLKSKRQIFQLHIPIMKGDSNHYITFLEDMIILQSRQNYLQIFDEKTRKFTLTFKKQDQWYKQLFLINNNKMLSREDSSRLIIWYIDFNNQCLIKNRILPLNVYDLYQGKPSFGYFYLIYNYKLQIIDESYQSIFQGESLFSSQIHWAQMLQSVSQQLNSHRIFIIFQNGIIITYNRWNLPIKKTIIELRIEINIKYISLKQVILSQIYLFFSFQKQYLKLHHLINFYCFNSTYFFRFPVQEFYIYIRLKNIQIILEQKWYKNILKNILQNIRVNFMLFFIYAKYQGSKFFKNIETFFFSAKQSHNIHQLKLKMPDNCRSETQPDIRQIYRNIIMNEDQKALHLKY